MIFWYQWATFSCTTTVLRSFSQVVLFILYCTLSFWQFIDRLYPMIFHISFIAYAVDSLHNSPFSQASSICWLRFRSQWDGLGWSRHLRFRTSTHIFRWAVPRRGTSWCQRTAHLRGNGQIRQEVHTSSFLLILPCANFYPIKWLIRASWLFLTFLYCIIVDLLIYLNLHIYIYIPERFVGISDWWIRRNTTIKY